MSAFVNHNIITVIAAAGAGVDVFVPASDNDGPLFTTCCVDCAVRHLQSLGFLLSQPRHYGIHACITWENGDEV